jgi:hypothetical protein
MGPLRKVLGILWKTFSVLLTLVFLAFASGCATTTYRGDSDATLFWCDTNKPVRPALSSIDTMTDDQLREMLAHNRYGQKTCGWRH